VSANPNDDGVKQVVHVYPKSGGTAALLELGGGFFFQVFGVGHIYAGNVGTGLFIMFGYWVLQFINALLTFVLIGFVTLPLTWVLALIISPIWAAKSCGAR
jgi:TM2 domain-containing membrane protein YozV